MKLTAGQDRATVHLISILICLAFIWFGVWTVQSSAEVSDQLFGILSFCLSWMGTIEVIFGAICMGVVLLKATYEELLILIETLRK